jgi:hypothetical protein
MSPQILSLIVFAENIHLNLNQPTEIVVCAPALSKEKGIKHPAKLEHNEISKITKFGCKMMY